MDRVRDLYGNDNEGISIVVAFFRTEYSIPSSFVVFDSAVASFLFYKTNTHSLVPTTMTTGLATLAGLGGTSEHGRHPGRSKGFGLDGRRW